MNARPIITAEMIPAEWPSIVRGCLDHDGQAIRGPIDRAVLEVKDLTTNRWGILLLPGTGTTFESVALRDKILRQILAQKQGDGNQENGDREQRPLGADHGKNGHDQGNNDQQHKSTHQPLDRPNNV